MKYFVVFSLLLFSALESKAAVPTIQECMVLTVIDTFPIISFDAEYIDIGEVNKGDIVEFDIPFTNTGNADLKIEVITACKCIDIDWSQDIIPPGAKSNIKVIFDSANQDKGTMTKIIDIIANTNPLVVEAKVKGLIK